MTEYKYEIWQGGTKLASVLDIDNALLFIGAYLDKYYLESIELTIRRKEV